MRRRFDLLVFDWDGTIVDSTAMIAACIQKAAADLGLAVPTLERASHVIGLGLQDALARAVPDLPAARVDEFSARYRHHYFACEPDIVLFEGIRAAGRTCRRRTCCSRSQPARAARWRAPSKRRVWAGSSSPALRGRNAFEPHPAMLLELAEELNVAPSAP
jgi:phosphoglycolate phosphatase